MDEFHSLVNTEFPRWAEWWSEAYRVGGWVVGEWVHDPRDDSFFWVEKWDSAGVVTERLCYTSPQRRGVWSEGVRLMSDDVQFPADPVLAHLAYVGAVRRLIDPL